MCRNRPMTVWSAEVWDLWMGFEEQKPKGTLLDGLWKYFKWYIDSAFSLW